MMWVAPFLYKRVFRRVCSIVIVPRLRVTARNEENEILIVQRS